jgi:hypothetical protein
MAYVVTITYGSTTLTLTSSPYAISYTPQDPGENETIVESATLRIIESSLSNMQTAIRDINKAFEMARRRRQTGTGDRVYLTLLESGDSQTYRSELWAANPSELPGRLQPIDPTMVDRIFTANVSQFRIIWSRKGYWELSTETELPLENGSGAGTGGIPILNPHTTAVLSGATISFSAPSTISDSGSGLGIFAEGNVISVRGSASNDGIYTVNATGAGSITVTEPITTEGAGASISIYDINNYVHIDAGNIGGTMPMGCRIRMVNDTASDLETTWIANAYVSTVQDFAHLLEFEDSDTGSNTSDAAASSGKYRAYTVTSSEAKITGWTIPSETLIAANSGYFRGILRFFNGTSITSCRLRLKIYYSSQLLFDGPLVEYDDTYAGISRLWRELNTIQLPPFNLEGNTPTDLTLELWGVSTTGGNITLNLDCMMLMPVSEYRKMKSNSGVAQNSILFEDSILGLYYQTVSSEHVQDVTVEGSPIMLWPNVDNRIYFIQHSETANTAAIDRQVTVRVYYRQRRATL